MGTQCLKSTSWRAELGQRFPEGEGREGGPIREVETSPGGTLGTRTKNLDFVPWPL